MKNDFESNYLAHHQRLGAKWGIMNGPPYPLRENQLSSAEKKHGGVAKSLVESYKNHKKKKQRKKALEKARQAKARKALEKKQAEARQAEAQRKAEEFEREKERIIRSGNAKEIMEYKDHLSNNEFQSALNRIRNEEETKKYVAASQKSGFDKINNMMGKADKVYNWAQTSKKWYNMTADIYNTFLADEGREWKKIPG